jgi:colanic acid biosynthesis protein WcaH
MISEPQPGEWLETKDFEHIVRLTPLVSIDLLVRSPDGRVLVGRRKNAPAKDIYFVPGGRITKNETLAQAFKRLTQVELGREEKIESARFRGVYEHIYGENRLGKAGFGTHYVVLAYEINLALDGASLPTDQHDDYQWMTIEKLIGSAEVHQNTRAYFRAPLM